MQQVFANPVLSYMQGRAIAERKNALAQDPRDQFPSYEAPALSYGNALSQGGMEDYANAIASVESKGSGDYSAMGPVMGSGSYTGDRAYGRYQVMGRNIPEWTREALGQSLTPQQFLQSPEAQDAVFKHYFGKSVEKYGNPQDAASVWFTGQPLSKGGGRSDGYITGNEYVNKFTNALARG